VDNGIIRARLPGQYYGINQALSQAIETIMTEQDYIKTLPQRDQDFIAFSRSHIGQMVAYILVNGEVIKTDTVVAGIWHDQSPDGAVVAKDFIGNLEVSTVFSAVKLPGDNHFETAIIDPIASHRIVDRYRTYQDAQAGHARAVASLTA
jgi:hypothetical protein